MDIQVSAHARRRMQQRGVSPTFLAKLLDNADVERPSSRNCRLYRVTRERAGALGDEKLGRFAVIWSDDGGKVVTVLPIAAGRGGSYYRRKH